MTGAELGVILTIAAAIGVPMQVPDRGMLAPIIILALVLLFQRGQGIWHFYSPKSEQASMGDVSAIIKDGRILMENLSMLGLSHDRLFSVLRSRGILHLGQVQRGYVEVTGDFSLYKFRQPPSGLSIVPETDPDLRKALRPDPSHFACSNCGERVPGPLKPEVRCFHCQYLEWAESVWTDLFRSRRRNFSQHTVNLNRAGD